MEMLPLLILASAALGAACGRRFGIAPIIATAPFIAAAAITIASVYGFGLFWGTVSVFGALAANQISYFLVCSLTERPARVTLPLGSLVR